MSRRLLLLGTVLTLAACGRTEAPATNDADTRETPAVPAAAAGEIRIDPGMLRDLRMTTGTVEARTAAADVDMLGEIGVDGDAYAEVAPPIDAQVVGLAASVNAAVSAGAPLAELRSPELGRARAELMMAQARAQLATQTLDRKRALAAERIVAARELEEAASQSQEAEAAVGAATAAIRALGVNPADPAIADDPSRFTLRSPLAGTVLERRVALGQYAQPASPMFTIADLRRVWLTVHAFERDAVQLAQGTAVRITLAAMPGREYTGRVALVSRQVDPSSRTVAVRIDLPNGDGALRPGMSATAHVPVKGDDRMLLAVASASVQRVGEDWVAFVPKGEGVFAIRRIGRGRDLGPEVEVVSGLQAGETVVVDGAFLLKAEAEKAAGGDEHEH